MTVEHWRRDSSARPHLTKHTCRLRRLSYTPAAMAGDLLPMTQVGVERLKSELKQLKTVERAKNVRDIEEARAHGDLLENAIARSEVIDVTKFSGDKVMFGATVTISDEETGKEIKYRLVGELEADL